MTRNEIESQFTVQDGCIKDCGKFEGEFVYAPYFSEFASDGEILSSMEDGCGNFTALIEVTDNDRKEFPEIDADTVAMLVTETDQGFVMVTELTAAKAENVRRAY